MFCNCKAVKKIGTSTSKGQFFSLDLYVAVALALLIGTIATSFWIMHFGAVDTREDRADMQRAALDASTLLIRTTLVSEPNIFGTAEIVQTLNETYGNLRVDLGLQGYEYYVQLRNENDTLINQSGVGYEFGAPPVDAEHIVVLTRYGVLDSAIVKMELEVWE